MAIDWNAMNACLVNNGLAEIDEQDVDDLCARLLQRAADMRAEFGVMGDLMANDLEARVQTVYACRDQSLVAQEV